jgi:Tol biopolymer transport system component
MIKKVDRRRQLLSFFLILPSLLGVAICARSNEAAEQRRGGGRPAQAMASERTPQPQGARSSKIRSIRIVHEVGARPRFSPDGTRIVFDRLNTDRYYDVYTSRADGSDVRPITDGKSGIGQRNNGNAMYHPDGKFIVFVSEEMDHIGNTMRRLGDPGIGLFSNFYATTPDGTQFWQLTDIPIKRNLRDRNTPSVGSVNPVFSHDGSRFVWTERYAEGGNNNWGRWRIKIADFRVVDGRPELRNERVLFTPERGNYATAMEFLDERRLVMAGNLEGQHEYGMDQYVLDIESGRTTNLTNTPEVWEEDSTVSPNGRIVYMTNTNSRYKFDKGRADWFTQPVEREYYIMNADGSGKERLTYFNDPQAPEHLDNRVLVAAVDISPDGRYMTGIVGVDHGKGNRRENVVLKVGMFEFATPLR